MLPGDPTDEARGGFRFIRQRHSDDRANRNSAEFLLSVFHRTDSAYIISPQPRYRRLGPNLHVQLF